MEISSRISVIVTGGASGLGAATARHLAGLGARVAVFDRDEVQGQAVARDIGGVFCLTDVTDAANVDESLARARQAHGQERVLVNCAGIAIGEKIAHLDRGAGRAISHDMARFQKVIAVNLTGTFLMAARCAAGMITQQPVTPDGGRGIIINTASVAAQDGQVGQTAYAASKGGVAALTLPLARDLAREGVRCMAIMPGIFRTPMVAQLPKEVQDGLAASVPFPRRLGEPEDYARLVAHLIENDMLNGETIRLDGALRMMPR